MNRRVLTANATAVPRPRLESLRSDSPPGSGATETGIGFRDSSKRPELPQQNNYETAEAMARQSLTQLDAAKQADRCGAEILMAGRDGVELRFDWFGRPVGVSFPDGAVRNVWDGVEVPIWERIILLHYVGSIAPVSESSDLIGFNEVPSGSFYLGAFVRRTHRPLAEFFGRKPKEHPQEHAAIG